MKRAIIDADGHVIERDEQIKPYLDEPYRSHPDLLNVPFFPTLDGWNRAARRIADGKGKGMPAPDAKAWLGFLDAAGVEATVLFPINGLALIPLQDIGEAVKELRRAVTALRMVGAILPAVGLRRPLGDPYYDPVYEEAQRLGAMLAVHGAPAQGLGFDFFERLVEARALSHPFAQMIQLTSVMLNGVLERFPDLRLAFMEAGAGWVPFMLERLDREAKNRGAGLRSLPSEELRSDRIFFHCELDERMLPVAVDALSAGQFFCASDFPHEPTHEFLESVTAFQTRTDLSDAVKARIMYDNAKRLY